MYNAKPTTGSASLIGTKKNYKPENKQFLAGVLLTPTSTTIATEALGETESTYLDLLKQASGRGYLIKAISEMEDQTADASVQEFPNGGSATIMAGNYKWQGYCNLPDGIMANWFSLNDKDWSGYLIWNNDSIQGYKDSSGVIFYPLRIKELKVVKSTLPVPDGVKRLIFTITFAEKKDMDENIIVCYPTTWSPTNLQSSRYVNMENAADGGDNTATLDVLDDTGNGQENLVVADFVSSSDNPSSITDSGGGSYILAGLTTGSQTFTLVAASAISISDAMIESAGVSDAAVVTGV